MGNLDLMADEAYEWCRDRDKELSSPTANFWAEPRLVRSALQKAVRRGHGDEAARLAIALYARRGEYALRSLLTVSLEDVGFNAPEALLWCIAARSAWFRERVGPRRLLVAIARELARAPKSRVACDLSFVGDEKHRLLYRRLAPLPVTELSDHARDADPFVAYVSLSLLVGTAPRGVLRAAARLPDLQLIAEAVTEELPARLARAAVAALCFPLDNMSAATPVAFRIASEATDAAVDCSPVESLGTVAGVRSEALDQHVPVGRTALRVFAGELSGFADEWIGARPTSLARWVGDAVFLEEGQLLRGQVHCAALDELQREADDLTLERHGLTSRAAQLLRKQVRDALPRLHEIRLQVTSQPQQPVG